MTSRSTPPMATYSPATVTTEATAAGAKGPGAPFGAALHPLLFAVFPLLSLFAQNQTDVELSVLWWPLALCLVATLVLFAVLLLVTKRPDKAGVITSLLVVGFFYFGLFADKTGGLGYGVQLVLWLALIVAGVVVVARTKRPLRTLTLILTVG